MALEKCPDCGKEISDTAEKCPNCGSTSLAKERSNANKGSGIITIVVLFFGMKYWGRVLFSSVWIFITFLVAVVVGGAFLGDFLYNQNRR